MVEAHRLNPNAMLVLLGVAIYTVAGGVTVVTGGAMLAMVLVLRNRPRGSAWGPGGPTLLFGPPVVVEDGRRSLVGPYLRPIPASS
ncbi:MAG TPA: hypothetical protein VF136_12900 [Methylomirabilota bacterium]